MHFMKESSRARPGSRLVALAFAITSMAAGGASAQALAPNAPKDKPVTASSVARMQTAIAPYVAQARASYPQAKARYLAGLPKGQAFFLTLPLSDAEGHVEQVFVAVRRIADGQVSGAIASDILSVKGYRNGQAITFPESQAIDWLISKPDGSEEGNVVGKYLETHGAN
jgi:hypothetical protein